MTVHKPVCWTQGHPRGEESVPDCWLADGEASMGAQSPLHGGWMTQIRDRRGSSHRNARPEVVSPWLSRN